MTICYIASPYTGQEKEGVERQIIIADLLIEVGITPIVPLLFHYIQEKFPHPHSTWMKLDLEILSRCDIMYRHPTPSPGADIEERYANENGIKVYNVLNDIVMEYGDERK